MRHFDYQDGAMFAENVSLARIAEEVGTPVYVYSTATFTRHYRVFADCFADTEALIAYSVKANSNIAVLATLAEQGAGADVVSGGELKRALIAGIPANKIVFSGVGKTREEMRDALTAGIRVFNVESLSELHVLNTVAVEMDKVAPVAFRFRQARKKTNSVSHGRALKKPMQKPQPYPASKSLASMFILAAKFQNLRHLKPRL